MSHQVTGSTHRACDRVVSTYYPGICALSLPGKLVEKSGTSSRMTTVYTDFVFVTDMVDVTNSTKLTFLMLQNA
jgi:hypothetical protein